MEFNTLILKPALVLKADSDNGGKRGMMFRFLLSQWHRDEHTLRVESGHGL